MFSKSRTFVEKSTIPTQTVLHPGIKMKRVKWRNYLIEIRVSIANNFGIIENGSSHPLTHAFIHSFKANVNFSVS